MSLTNNFKDLIGIVRWSWFGATHSRGIGVGLEGSLDAIMVLFLGRSEGPINPSFDNYNSNPVVLLLGRSEGPINPCVDDNNRFHAVFWRL